MANEEILSLPATIKTHQSRQEPFSQLATTYSNEESFDYSTFFYIIVCRNQYYKASAIFKILRKIQKKYFLQYQTVALPFTFSLYAGFLINTLYL